MSSTKALHLAWMQRFKIEFQLSELAEARVYQITRTEETLENGNPYWNIKFIKRFNRDRYKLI